MRPAKWGFLRARQRIIAFALAEAASAIAEAARATTTTIATS